MTCTVLVWAAVLIALPLIVLFWLTESQQQRCRRLRRNGWSQQRIADHLRISRSTVKRRLTAA
ncbi:helix-turn-helix domain-containing protein [Synechococcus sp. NB0720_010]|uniref:helix-turn-helix domain-containing protein n=1 Tax=Synechococcus sp. NB0720_010 TaxID=2907159 RepID=UPI0035302462